MTTSNRKIIITLTALKKFTLVVFLVFLGIGVGFRLGKADGGTKSIPSSGSSSVQISPKEDLTSFWQVWQILEDKFIDKAKMNGRKMVDGAISGMVSALGDPYTAYFPPTENKMSKEDLNGEFGGVGIQLGFSKDGILAVISPLDNTPASRGGLRAGDLILKIQDKKKNIDQSTEKISVFEAVDLIRGPADTEVTLTILSEGDKASREVTLKREKITVPSVVTKWIETGGKKYAYVHLVQFTEVMYDQWNKWVTEVAGQASSKNFGGVILDLRNNPGGLLDGAVFVASDFIKEGVVVEQENSDGKKQLYRVSGEGKLIDVPLVVVVNAGSASAAEILAGSLQHYQRAQVVGETTFGKGTVQEPQDLPDGSGLHVTVSRWLIPGGKSIDKEGITPDIVVKEDGTNQSKDLPLEKAIEVIRSKNK